MAKLFTKKLNNICLFVKREFLMRTGFVLKKYNLSLKLNLNFKTL